MKKNFMKSRALKHGALATALTIGFIVVVVVVNAIAGILLDRYPLTIDLTKDNRYTLTEDSLQYIANIDTPVNITVCRSEADFENYVGQDTSNNAYGAMFKQAYEILKDYTRNNPNITLQFIDLNQNPTFADKYPNETLTNAHIIVESELRYKLIQMSSLFTATKYSDSYISYKSKAEQTMTSAIMYVLDNDPVTVIALNNTQTTLPDFMTLLSNNSYNIVERNSLTDELDADADVVVLAGQTADLSEEELDKLDKWLDNNGKFQKTLIYVPTMTLNSMPNLEEFLQEWGMSVDTGYIAETDGKKVMSQNAYMVLADLADTDYADNVSVTASQVYLAAFSHPVNTLWEKSQNRSTMPLITTGETAVVVSEDSEDTNLNVLPQDTRNVAVLGYRSKYVDNELVSSNVLVFGSETALTGTAISHAALSNGNVSLAFVNTAVGSETEVSIVAVDFDAKTIAVTASQIKVVLIVFVIAIPAVILILAVITFFRRRHL